MKTIIEQEGLGQTPRQPLLISLHMRTLFHAYYDLIRYAKKWLAASVAIFCIASAAGLIVGFSNPDAVKHVVDRLPTNNLTGFADFMQIAKHNLKSMLIMWCGSLALGILPVLEIVVLGFAAGGLLVRVSFGYWILSIVPHGIIELPAMLLSNAFFLRLGLRWISQKDPTARKRVFVADLRDSFKIALLCAPLLCVAASIEAFGTAKFLDAYNESYSATIGISFKIENQDLTIDRVAPGGPAAKAALSTNLVIQKINDSYTAGKSAQACAEMTRGRVGSVVKLELVDMVNHKTNTVKLVRELRQ